MGSMKYSTFVSLLCALYGWQPTLAADSKVFEGWRLKQMCTYQGDEDLTICNYGVKIVNPHNGLTAIYTAPYKVVSYYDLRTGLSSQIPIDKNDNPYQKTVAIMDGFLLCDIPVHKVGSSDVCGLPATKYETDPEYAVKQKKACHANGTSDNEAAFATYDVLNSVKADPLALKFVAKFYGIPYRDGLPGFFKYTRINGKIKRHLETSRCVQAKIAADEFAIPPNLKHAKSAQEVLSGADAYMMGL